MYFRHDTKRKSQDILIKDIKYSLENGFTGLFEAPTGLGKTDASLSSVLEFAEKNNKKVFFITPKNSQHKIVIETIKGINKKFDKKFKIIDLVSKSNLCIDPFLFGLGPEFYELCEKKMKNQSCLPYLNATGKGPFKNKLLDKLIQEHSDAMHHNEFRELCLKHDVCPYASSISLAKTAQLIVCDVNYIFVNKIRNSLFNALEISLNDCVFIFDEAHNLPNRLRTILSDSLSNKQINYAQKEWDKSPKQNLYDITEFLETFEYYFDKLKNGFIDENYFDELFLNEEIYDSLIKAGDFILETEKKKPYLYKIAGFMASWLEDKKVKTRFKNNDTISIKGLDPSYLSKDVFNDAYASILMSATFSPIKMYVDLLGIKNPYIKQYESPFPKENKLIQYVEDVTTKYEERKESVPKISEIIVNVVNKVSGNIAVFFPSYDVLQSVYLRISEKIIKKIYVQEKNLTQLQTQRLVDNFKKNKIGFGSVLFAVVGGSFSEGVDYPGDDLIGIIMVGLPFPEPDLEMNALIAYYDNQKLEGWNYAYLYPTISKVVQACGRGIRSETDRAFILLLDKRFSWPKYKSLFPIDYNLQKYDNKKFQEFILKL
jgi:DNA excision repair protein ERCC-2